MMFYDEMKTIPAPAASGIWYFIDTADTEKVKAAFSIYPLSGVTTNPTILSREAGNPVETLKAIRKEIGEAMLFAQVTSDGTDAMVKEAELLLEALGHPLSVKIPATPAGLAAIRILRSEGICTTATAVYKPEQALLAALAGASFVAPYVSHIDNLGMDSAAVISEMAELIERAHAECTVLAASFRTAEQVHRSILAGAGAVTVTAEMAEILFTAAGTETEVESFRRNWKAVFGDKQIGDFLKE